MDFSYRFFKNRASTQYPGRKNPGGVEAARYVVRISYEPQIGKKLQSRVAGENIKSQRSLYTCCSINVST